MNVIQPKILIAGIGNVFRGDDAFGVELAQRLLRRKLPLDVRVVDFGIRELDLAYALMDDPPVAILLDATSRGGTPGTVYTIEIRDADIPPAVHAGGVIPSDVELEPAHEAHALSPTRVLQMVRRMGGGFNQIFLVGCEPLTFGSDEDGMPGLSAPVRAAVEKAVDVVESLIASLRFNSVGSREFFECQALR